MNGEIDRSTFVLLWISLLLACLDIWVGLGRALLWLIGVL